ncbi:DUF2793 domain-containing protein [Segnochrobactrum spirostomi]|uniref:DUF2793 domain-containing protein n=1 Tax=Segnochrobactrum spirostomi TaxID=2608987 RepID=A0A6A7Y077_9HYPH|nr:DUF2793 domain-containing protein [Segnochrobactrum spirostomi]MQT12314.1 DUF2793 domain-containing protein [Segnochrobactrum spirostomi]
MAEETTIRLGLPLVAAAQAQKHVTVNEALLRLDALTQPRIASVSLGAPPSAAEGDLYGVPSGAGGAWSGAAGQLALRSGGDWVFLPAGDGMIAFIADEGRIAVRHGEDWVTALAVSPHGAATLHQVIEGDVDLLGDATDGGALIPERAIVLAVTTRTLTAVTGAPAYDCGIAGEPAKFGGGLGAAAGSTNAGVIGPTAFYAPTPVRLSATTGSFTGGRVRYAIHCLRPTIPAA